MLLPKNNATDFTPAPAGTHVAVCYRLVDLGTQAVEFQGDRKHQHKVLIGWELPNERMEDGKPFTISKRYTWSTHEKATLRQHLESWRGKKFAEPEIEQFDTRKLLGVGCTLSIAHEERQGKTYASITGIGPMMKGTTAPKPENQIVYFTLDQAFDADVFSALPQGLRETIQKSPEYHKLNGQAPTHNGSHDLSDEVPF